ncbi:MAG: transposase [Flavisolibacter sp.]|nr:transposase [Flavisolibacter sp.]
MGYEKYSKEGHHTGNSRNGSYPKKVKTESPGDMVLSIPGDRNSEFSSKPHAKGQRMSDKLQEAIVGMYSRGMTTSDISEQAGQVYGMDVSGGTISNVTARITEQLKEWQQRPLEAVYYVVIGLQQDGLKEVLGMWVTESQSASFWLTVLTDLKHRFDRLLQNPTEAVR